MAGGVATGSSYLQGGIKVCDVCVSSLTQASSSLNSGYQAAGSGWQDSKYRELGQIVNECCQALTKPITELNSCRASLERLLAAVQEYEATSL